MIPFTIHELKLFAPVSLNGQATIAHLDTGATQTTIGAGAARGLEKVGSSRMRGGLGQRKAEFVRIPTLEFLGETFEDTTAAVVDSESYFAGVPFPVSLTLGAPILTARPLVLDFRRHWIGFAGGPLRPDLETIEAEFIKGLPLLNLRMDGHGLRAAFDTGAAYSVFNSAHLDEIGMEPEEVYSLEVNDPTGATSWLPVYRAGETSVSGIPLGPCEFLTVDLSPVEQGLDARVDFVFGANAMLTSGLVWVIDREHSCLRLAERGVDVT